MTALVVALLGKDFVERVRVEHPIKPALDLFPGLRCSGAPELLPAAAEAFGELPLQGLQLTQIQPFFAPFLIHSLVQLSMRSANIVSTSSKSETSGISTVPFSIVGRR